MSCVATNKPGVRKGCVICYHLNDSRHHFLPHFFLNLLNSYSTIVMSPYRLQNEQKLFQQFLILQLEWGACELVNDVSEKGCRMIQQFDHVLPV